MAKRYCNFSILWEYIIEHPHHEHVYYRVRHWSVIISLSSFHKLWNKYVKFYKMIYSNILQAKPRLLYYQVFINLKWFKSSSYNKNMQINLLKKVYSKITRKYLEAIEHISWKARRYHLHRKLIIRIIVKI